MAEPKKAPRQGWPKETKNTHVSTPSGDVSIERATIPKEEMTARLGARNARLKLLGEPELQLVEGLAARLYTGPMVTMQRRANTLHRTSTAMRISAHSLLAPCALFSSPSTTAFFAASTARCPSYATR